MDPRDTEIPGVGPRTKVRIVVSGWDYLLWILLPERAFARRIARAQIEVYSGRSPIIDGQPFLLQLPDGSYWRVIDATKDGVLDLDVEPYEEPG